MAFGTSVAKRTQNPKQFGAIAGIPVGQTYIDRAGVSADAIHAPIIAGIYGDPARGAYSLVLSGGYEDDEDKGEIIEYTGAGGRDKTVRGGEQIEDQQWKGVNRALQVSAENGRPVRVVRGHTLPSAYAPSVGYRYDGLYTVEEAWTQVGQRGFKICRFRLRRNPNQTPLPDPRVLIGGITKKRKTSSRTSSAPSGSSRSRPSASSRGVARSSADVPAPAPYMMAKWEGGQDGQLLSMPALEPNHSAPAPTPRVAIPNVNNQALLPMKPRIFPGDEEEPPSFLDSFVKKYGR